MAFLKAFAGSFLGRIVATFALALAAALGFGPEEWVKAVMPFLQGPTSLLVARFVFIAVGLSVFGLWVWSRWSSLRPTEHVTRIKYFSRQTVTRPNFEDKLDLDSVATLLPFGAWNRRSVNMMLQVGVPFHVENPRSGQAYEFGGARVRANLEKGLKVLKMGGWSSQGESKHFMFSTDNPVHLVETAAGRKYRVELTSITDKSSPNQTAFKYDFSIAEQ